MTDVSGIGKRIKALRKKNGFSQAYVAEKLCVTQSAYSLIESSRNGIVSEHVVALSRLYGVTTDFLLTGNENLIDRSRENGFIPFVEIKAHAGFLENLHEEDLFDSFEHFRIPGYNPTQDSLLMEVEGNSMEPSILPGEIIICQAQSKLDRVPEGSAVVVITRDQVVITRFYKHDDPEFFWTESDNPEHSGRNKIRRSDVRQLLMVRGKVSNLCVPIREAGSKGKLKPLEESLGSLAEEIYRVRKRIDKLDKE